MIISEGSLKLNDEVKTAVTVGKFDGLHKGHRLLLERIAAEKKNGLESVVVSIEERKERAKLLLPGETEELLEKLGICAHLHLYLDPEIRDLEPEEFVRRCLSEMLHASFIALGSDFSFGKNRAGNAKTLEEAGRVYGFRTEVIERITEDGEVISSASVREAIREGNLRKADRMLGYPYFVRLKTPRKSFEEKEDFIVFPFPKGRVIPRSGRYLSEVTDGAGIVRTEVLIEDGERKTAELFIPRQSLETGISKAVQVSFLDFLGAIENRH